MSVLQSSTLTPNQQPHHARPFQTLEKSSSLKMEGLPTHLSRGGRGLDAGKWGCHIPRRGSQGDQRAWESCPEQVGDQSEGKWGFLGWLKQSGGRCLVGWKEHLGGPETERLQGEDPCPSAAPAPPVHRCGQGAPPAAPRARRARSRKTTSEPQLGARPGGRARWPRSDLRRLRPPPPHAPAPAARPSLRPPARRQSRPLCSDPLGGARGNFPRSNL